ncbi:hypothetical protein GGS24DRAFT_463021 [Hypoxylon argillaceum]|nr:hypothetical protein GGS24DRAFT_463021 [Hypoxylon argillaceum]
MAELGRVAQAAIRSTSLLRVAPIRSQPCRNLVLTSSIAGRNHLSTTSFLRAPDEPPRSFSWTNPSRDSTADLDIRKPSSSSYNLAFGGERDKGKEDKASAEFASDIGLDIADIHPNRTAKGEIPAAPRAYVRMVPRTGRTIYVKNNVDVARSFKLLAIQVAQNGLRRDTFAQRFHERPGLKRKRQKSQRWQKRFKTGFKATISRVRELTAQGW